MVSRVSDYNIILPLDGSDSSLVVQGVSGSFDVVGNDIAAVLRTRSVLTVEDSGGVSAENLETLKRRGYVTDRSVDEERAFIASLSEALGKRSQRAISLTIMPTYNCNFRCEYCFEGPLQESHGKQWLARTMSVEMVDAVFAQLAKFRDDGLILESVYLFGGEPLLRPNQAIVRYICEKARDLGIPIMCVTNGYDLDSYVDLIKEFGFNHVQVTVDGIKEEHDKRRFLAGGQPTYERIMRNVDLALSQGVPVVLRTNVNKKNVDQVHQLIDTYRSRGWLEYDNFKYYFKSTLKCFDEAEDAYSDLELMGELTREYGAEASRFRLNSIYAGVADGLRNMLANHTFAPFRSGYCGAIGGMYTVDPGGDIYACWDVVADPSEVIGTVDVDKGEFVLNDHAHSWKGRTVDKIDSCRSCKYLLFCGGGCAAMAKVNSGTLNASFCDDFQRIFNEVAVDVTQEHLAGAQAATTSGGT